MKAYPEHRSIVMFETRLRHQVPCSECSSVVLRVTEALSDLPHTANFQALAVMFDLSGAVDKEVVKVKNTRSRVDDRLKAIDAARLKPPPPSGSSPPRRSDLRSSAAGRPHQRSSHVAPSEESGE